MKKTVLIFLIFVTDQFALAQNRVVDSLFKAIENHKRLDSTKVKMLYRYGFVLMDSDHSEGLAALEKGVELAGNIKWKVGEAHGLNTLVSQYNRNGKIKDAIEAGLKAIRIGEELQHPGILSKAHMEIAHVYRLMGNFADAKYHGDKSFLEAEKSGDEEFVMQSNLLLSYIYNDMQNWEMAEKYLETALNLAVKRNNPTVIIRSLDMKATKARLEKKYKISKDYYLQILSIGKGPKRHAFSSFYKSMVAFTYANLNQKDSAVYYGNSALEEAKEYKLKKETRDAYEALYQVYDQLKDYEKALACYTTFVKLQQEDYNMQTATDVANTRAEFEEAERKALADKEVQRQKFIRNTVLAGFGIVFVFAIVFFLQRNQIRLGKQQSDELLRNILPEEVAEELKAKGSADAKHFDKVTVMFTDFKGFSQISEKLTPTELVSEIHTCFKTFDEIIAKHNIEKIKTIGDAYMCAGGLPVANTTNANDVLIAAMEIQQFMKQHLLDQQRENKPLFEIRIGVHTGPVVAGIVGVKKYAYDIWGDTVNIAARMEQNSEAGKINISGSTYELVKDRFKCEHRGKIQAKNKGEIDMYFVEAVS